MTCNQIPYSLKMPNCCCALKTNVLRQSSSIKESVLVFVVMAFILSIEMSLFLFANSILFRFCHQTFLTYKPIDIPIYPLHINFNEYTIISTSKRNSFGEIGKGPKITFIACNTLKDSLKHHFRYVIVSRREI